MKYKVPAIPINAAQDFQGNVVIIGAGVSGLMAANALKYMKVENFIVLEASDRIGGRLKKTDDIHNDVPLDVGAEWIHSKDEQVVKDILVFDAGEDDGLQPSEFIKYQPDFFFRKKKSKLLSHLYQETKWKRSTWWHWLDQYVYNHVSEKVKFQSPVKEIVYTDNGVSVITEAEEIYEADKVIVTIPLACLKKNTIQFTPALPQKKLEAMKQVEMPPGFRIFFEMKEKFYPDVTINNGLLRQIFMDGDDVSLMYDALLGKELDSTKHILGFVAIGSKHAGEFEQLHEDELVKKVLEKMDSAFGDQLGTKNYVKHVLQIWTLEPFIQGAYSFPTKTKLRLNLRETVGNNVLFAGEHTSIKYFSTVVGAAVEGRRAAVEAVSSTKVAGDT